MFFLFFFFLPRSHDIHLTFFNIFFFSFFFFFPPQNDSELRAKYGITEDMVKDFHPVPIIRIPGGDEDLGVEDFGDMAAVTACLQLKVRNQHDTAKLVKIKKSVYNKGFYAGVLTVGSQKGKTVEDAKVRQACVVRYYFYDP